MVFMNRGCHYVGEAITHLDCADIDMMSIVELDSILKESLGYGFDAVYYMKFPRSKKLEYIDNIEESLEIMALTLRTSWESMFIVITQ